MKRLGLALALAGLWGMPALAETPDAKAAILEELGGQHDTAFVAGAYRACLHADGQIDTIIPLFEEAKWRRMEGDDAGQIEFRPPYPADDSVPYSKSDADGVRVTLDPAAGRCTVRSDGLGTHFTREILGYVLMDGKFNVRSADGEGGCQAYALPSGVVAVLTSADPEPACESREHSVLRFSPPHPA